MKEKNQTIEEMKVKGRKLETLIDLSNNLREQEKRQPINFNDFLFMASQNPEFVFRDIFQLFYDMFNHYVETPKDDWEGSPEYIGFIGYDFFKMFESDCDEPFFSDRLFSNRLMNLVRDFRKSTQNKNIFLFEGPPGSGKSTFLNILLQKLEDYAITDAGATYKTYWRLDIDYLGGFTGLEKYINLFAGEKSKKSADSQTSTKKTPTLTYPDKHLEFSCPNHDHPILLIPKSFRQQFLDELIEDVNFKHRLFTERQFEWVLKDVPCSICSSLYKYLLDRFGDPLKIYDMIFARKNFYKRQFGEGISVFNPGDPVHNEPIVNQNLQALLNDLLSKNNIRFSYSYLAKTNNGVLALMDIKEHNVERLKDYHGIISDGIHKVELTEERIKTLFLGLVNPEDKVHYETVKSFQDRIVTVLIPYILDYNTEVKVYKAKFGQDIESNFLPGVLNNFARIIISSRMEKDSPHFKKWIEKPEKYSKYLDKNMLLLKMEIYSGNIPEWVTEEDIKRFDKNLRKEIITAADKEGAKGFSGRQSLSIFGKFLNLYSNKFTSGESNNHENGDSKKMITMQMVKTFYEQQLDSSQRKIMEAEVQPGFISSLVDMYNYDVLQEVKESIYYYNDKQISSDIINYLFAINFEPGETKKCEDTGDIIEISEDFFKNFEALFLGTTSTTFERKNFRNDMHQEYITNTLSREIRIDGKKIQETEQFKQLFEKYTRNLKENALVPYIDNDNFRRAIQEYFSPSFHAYEERIKRDVNLLINNLKSKFTYTAEGAVQVSLYVLDHNLAKKY
ncbi:MAG: putative serine protein kinase, PrkA [Ignavibacteria bacterium]|nr:putative serine protein kinase, PrkA [Ignavibacteria bacterium]